MRLLFVLYLSAPKSQRFLRFAIEMPIADPRNRSDFGDRRAGSDPLLVGPAGNHSASFRVGLVSAKMRLVLAIIVWYVGCKS